jgi:hypothetical protein
MSDHDPTPETPAFGAAPVGRAGPPSQALRFLGYAALYLLALTFPRRPR